MYKAVCCSAKIGSSDDIEREVSTAKRFSGRKPCLMEVLGVIPMSMDDNNTRLAMITPLYSAVLHDFTGRKCLELFVRVTVCTFLSIREFNRIGFCHGDIKPKNLMVNSNSKFVTMIDFGESSRYGTDMMKDSMWYPLDCVRTASLHYDLTCLASTLWELWQGRGQQEEDVTTRAELRKVVASCENELVCRIITACLEESACILVGVFDEAFNVVLTLVNTHAADLLPNEIRDECAM
jgi:serine/threonine protein kinase